MPFKSKAQARWMYANKPKMAAEWEDKTDSAVKGGIAALPDKVGKGKPKRKAKPKPKK